MFGGKDDVGAQLTPVLRRRHVHIFLELFNEERGAGKAALIADLRHGGVGIGEQRFGVFEPLDDDILLGGNPHRVFKDVSEAVVGIIGDIGELFGRDFGEEIFVDVIDRLLQNVLMGGRFIQTGRSALDFHDDVAQKIGNDGNKILPPVLEFRGNEFEVVHHVAVFVRIASRGDFALFSVQRETDAEDLAIFFVHVVVLGVRRNDDVMVPFVREFLFPDEAMSLSRIIINQFIAFVRVKGNVIIDRIRSFEIKIYVNIIHVFSQIAQKSCKSF